MLSNFNAKNWRDLSIRPMGNEKAKGQNGESKYEEVNGSKKVNLVTILGGSSFSWCKIRLVEKAAMFEIRIIVVYGFACSSMCAICAFVIIEGILVKISSMSVFKSRIQLGTLFHAPDGGCEPDAPYRR